MCVHVTRAGNESQCSLTVVLKDKYRGAAPLALDDRQTLCTDSVAEVMRRKVKQTFFESISLRFIANGADPRFVSRWHQIIALALWCLALLQKVLEGTKDQFNTCTLLHYKKKLY